MLVVTPARVFRLLLLVSSIFALLFINSSREPQHTRTTKSQTHQQQHHLTWGAGRLPEPPAGIIRGLFPRLVSNSREAPRSRARPGHGTRGPNLAGGRSSSPAPGRQFFAFVAGVVAVVVVVVFVSNKALSEFSCATRTKRGHLQMFVYLEF